MIRTKSFQSLSNVDLNLILRWNSTNPIICLSGVSEIFNYLSIRFEECVLFAVAKLYSNCFMFMFREWRLIETKLS